MSNPDLQRLSAALEYVDLAAGLYLAGGADQAARLLAAAAEQQLGDLVRLIDAPSATVDTRELLARVARAHRPAVVAPRQAPGRDFDSPPTSPTRISRRINHFSRGASRKRDSHEPMPMENR